MRGSTWGERVFGLALLAGTILLIGGVFLAALGWRSGAFIAVGGFGVTVVANVTQGLVSYRRTMRRPWLTVPPIEDDDDEW